MTREIGSIGIQEERALDARKVNDWLSYLLQSRGEDILRMKGVLNIMGDERRYVFHGVHMMFDGRPDRPWGDSRARQPAGVHRSQARSRRIAGGLLRLPRMSTRTAALVPGPVHPCRRLSPRISRGHRIRADWSSAAARDTWYASM